MYQPGGQLARIVVSDTGRKLHQVHSYRNVKYPELLFAIQLGELSFIMTSVNRGRCFNIQCVLSYDHAAMVR